MNERLLMLSYPFSPFVPPLIQSQQLLFGRFITTALLAMGRWNNLEMRWVGVIIYKTTIGAYAAIVSSGIFQGTQGIEVLVCVLYG